MTNETTDPKTAAAPKAEPAVEKAAKFEPGDKVRHDNKTVYTVRFQNTEGVALEGVANLVHPGALRKI
jgi:hypothetical protein